MQTIRTFLLSNSLAGLTTVAGVDLSATPSVPIWLGHHSFGTVAMGTSLTCELALTNSDSTSWAVRKVIPSCECLSVVSFPARLEPHSVGRILVTAKARESGQANWSVLVETGASNRQGFFTLSASVDTATRAQSFLLSATDLLGSLDQDADLLVDARSRERYLLAHIPNSLNLSFLGVKTKPFLKSRRVILLNEGHNNSSLTREAAQLTQAGFQSVHVLDGGLRAWQRAGGTLEGPGVASGAWAELSPAQFHEAWSISDWLLVNVLPPGEPVESNLLPDAPQLPLEPAHLAAELSKLVEVSGRRVLVATPRGEGYAHIEQLLQTLPNAPIYYLSGGPGAYAANLAQQIAIRTRQLATVSSQPKSPISFNFGSTSGGRSSGCCGGAR